MQHTFYAVFDSAAAAANAVAELQQLDLARNHISPEDYDRHLATGSGTKTAATLGWVNPIIHRAGVVSGGELHGGESAFRRGAVSGAVAGGVLGAVGGLLLGPLAGAAGLAAIFGGVLGFVFGGVMGGISTAAGPDPILEKLTATLGDDQVLLTIEAPDLTRESDGETVIKRHGGQIQHRQLV